MSVTVQNISSKPVRPIMFVMPTAGAKVGKTVILAPGNVITLDDKQAKIHQSSINAYIDADMLQLTTPIKKKLVVKDDVVEESAGEEMSEEDIEKNEIIAQLSAAGIECARWGIKRLRAELETFKAQEAGDETSELLK